MNRHERKRKDEPRNHESTKTRKAPRMVACGKINKHGRETRIAFEFMGKLSQGAVRRVFGENTARGEEIANL